MRPVPPRCCCRKEPQEDADDKEIENTIATMARIPAKKPSKDDETVLANLDKELRSVVVTARTRPSMR
jgi:ATP-dependent Clp protease ATP-binding subunit ClpA